VALKLSWATDIAREWVEREAELTRLAAHPHVLPILESGRMGESAFHVTPIARSGTLAHVLDDGHAVPFENAARMLRELSSALDAAHRVGVIHGSLRAEKIFIASNGQYFVGDFAMRAGEWASGRGTAPSVIGDPAHMPNEQRHDVLDIDGQIDQFALAVVLYEALNGRRLSRLTRDGIVEVDVMDLAMARPIREGVPLSVTAAVRRATAREPGARFATVTEFVNAALGVKDVAPVAPPKQKDFDLWRQLRWVAVGLLAMSGVAFMSTVDTRIEIQRFWRNLRANGLPQRDFDIGRDPTAARGGGGTIPATTRSESERRGQSGAPTNTQRPGASPSPAPPGDGSDRPLRVGSGQSRAETNPPPRTTISPSERAPVTDPNTRSTADSTRAPLLDARPGDPGNLPRALRDSASRRGVADASIGLPAPLTRSTAEGARSAYVRVTVDAGAAEVTVDGVLWGRTPLVWSGPQGNHRIEIRHIGSGLASSRVVRARSGDTVTVTFGR
jgi:serine/threonine-protein kinase